MRCYLAIALLFLLLAASSAHAQDKQVLAGAKIDRVSHDFAALIGGAQDLSKDDLNLLPKPLVGFPPMLHAKMSFAEEDDPFNRGQFETTVGNFYEQGSKDKTPNTVFHNVATYNELIYSYGGLQQTAIRPVSGSQIDTSLQAFDTRSLRWIDLTDQVGGTTFPKVWGHCAVVVSSTLVILGGRTDAATTNPVFNEAMWFLDLDNLAGGWTSNSLFSSDPRFYDATCFTFNDGIDHLVTIGGRDENEAFPDITFYNITAGLSGDSIDVSGTGDPSCDDLQVPRFGADGDFWSLDSDIGSLTYFVVVGGFWNLQYNPIPAVNDENILIFDFVNGQCAISNLPPAPRPVFPSPQPVHRYSFNEEFWYNKLELESIPNNHISADWVGSSDARILGLSNQLNEGVVEIDGVLDIDRWGRYANALLIRDFHWGGETKWETNVLSFEMFFTTYNALNEYRVQDPANAPLLPKTVRLLDFGNTFSLDAGVLGPHTLGLYMDDQRRLVAYVTGDKPVDVWAYDDVFAAIDALQFEQVFKHKSPRGYSAGRPYASAIRSEKNLDAETETDFHIAVNYDMETRTMSIILDGDLVAEGEMLVDFKRSGQQSPTPFAAVARSLNQNFDSNPHGTGRLETERPFMGNFSEVRFYRGLLDEQRCQNMIAFGPDMAPPARGYHSVFAYGDNIHFTGGFYVDEAGDDHYLRPYTDFWRISAPATNQLIPFSSINFDPNDVSQVADFLAVDASDVPALQTQEITEFISTASWNFPLNRPQGTAIDLPAFRSPTFTIDLTVPAEDF